MCPSIHISKVAYDYPCSEVTQIPARKGKSVAQPTLPAYTTCPQLARDLNAPLWLIRRLVDRLGGAQRVAKFVRLIDADLAERVRAELARREEAARA